MKKEILIKEEDNAFLIEVEFDENDNPPKLEDYLLEDYEDEEEKNKTYKDDFNDWEISIEYDINRVYLIEKDKKIKLRGFLEDIIYENENITQKIEKNIRSFFIIS
jgi:hypothetical protein